MRRRIAVVATVAMALAGCGATGGGGESGALTTTTETEVEDPVSTTTEDEPTSTTTDDTTSTTEDDGPSTTEEPDETTTRPKTTTTVGSGTGTADEPLALGAVSTVGDFEVTVKAADLDATVEVQGGSEYNDPPTKGVYGLATIAVTYVGSEEGEPGFDLNVTVQGGNGRQYEEYECSAQIEGSSYDAPTLTSGGTAEYRVCWDLDPDAAAGSTIFVEDVASFDEEARTYWASA